MPQRVPQPTDFLSQLTLTITPAPSLNTSTTSSSIPHPPPNILLLLHGLGDTHIPLSTLATQMSLPETLCISLRAPTPLPFDLGHTSPSISSDAVAFHWGDDVVFDPGKPDGAIDVQACGYAKAVQCVREVLGVLRECGYGMRSVLVLGLGQGGGVALAVAGNVAVDGDGDAGGVVGGKVEQELGGVISVGGALPDEFRTGVGKGKSKSKGKTPILICHGKSGSAITVSKAKEIKEAYENVQIVQWDRAGDGMAKNRDEMMPIMHFFGKRLRSRAGIPEGAVEVG